MKKTILSIASFLIMFGAQSQIYYWTPITSGTTQNLNDVSIMNGSTAWAVGTSIRKTTDAGINWTEQTNPAGTELVSILMYSDNYGYASGMNGTLLSTTNGGATWNEISTGYTCTLTGLTGNGYPEIYAVCAESGDIVYSTDGINFSVMATWSPFTVNEIEFVSSSTGWVIGDDDILYNTTDAGLSWNTQSSPVVNKFLNSIDMLDANTGYIVGDNGTILKTTNGGANWISQTSGTTENLNDVCFISMSTGWAVGNNGTFIKTTNGGSTWTIQSGLTTSDMYGVSVVATSAGYTVGDGGEIYTLQDQASILENNEIGSVVLFPNPTTGLLNISEASDIRVVSLDGHVLHAATNTTSIDLSTLPNGLYFCEVLKNGTTIQRERIVRY